MRAFRAGAANLRATPARFAAVLAAIAIGVGFAVATLVFTASFRAELTRSVAADLTGVDVVVHTDGTAVIDLSQVPGVASSQRILNTSVQFRGGAAQGWLTVHALATDERRQWYRLTTGSFPQSPGEIGMEAGTAARAGVHAGDQIVLTSTDGAEVPATVVGLVDVGRSPLAGAWDEAFAAEDFVAQLGPWDVGSVAVTAAAGSSAADLAATLATVAGISGVDLGADLIAQQERAAVGEVDVLTTVLLTFAAVAGLVAAFVIANTFVILLTQRQRQIGLLRCVGATQPQVRAQVLAEATLVGVLGSLLGVLLGLAGGQLAMSIANVPSVSYTVPVVTVSIAAAIGVLVTLASALAPAGRAMRITPLAALSAVPTAAEERRTGLVRTAVAVTLLLVGGAGLAAGVLLPSLLVAVAGGAVSAVGVLLMLRTVLPVLLRALSGLGELAGTPGRLAVANAGRHPGRAAATAAALTIAVGLIVMLQVGAASAKAGLFAAGDSRYPLDVTLGSTDSTGTPQFLSAGSAAVLKVQALPGVRSTVLTGLMTQVSIGTQVSVGNGAATDAGAATAGGGASDAPGGIAMLLVGATPESGQIARTEAPARGTVMLPSSLLDQGRLVGAPATFIIEGRQLTLTIVAGNLANQQGTLAVANSADVNGLGRRAGVVPQPAVLWGQLADPDQPDEAVAELNRVVHDSPELQLGGSAADHARVNEGLGTLLLVVTGLLGVAAVIAVLGIGNTLGLSVVERTRESALLRALGLRRGQLRLMLAVEATLLALVGAVAGVLIGTGYGWAGAAAAFAEASEPVTLAFPVGQIGLVLMLAVAAGVLASVLPARRAVRATPTQALAQE